MAIQAKVTSTEALESFRASLVVFLAKARRSLDDAGDEVRQTRQWLQHDQRTHWEGELRRRAKVLDQAQQELLSVRLSAAVHQPSALMNRQMAVAKAQRDFAEVEGKLRRLKSWTQNYDASADPIQKRMDKLRQSLDELPKAISYLVSVQKTLEAYAESSGPSGVLPTETPPSSEPGDYPEPGPADSQSTS
jgi:DNA repair ATPase RecN